VASRIGLLIPGLALAGAVFVALGPTLLDPYTLNVLTRAFLYAVVAVTVDLLWGYTGVLTFGQSAFFGLGAYATALVFTHLGFGPGLAWLALILSVVVPMALALLVGWLSFHRGATALYASVVSLALPIVVVQLLFSGGTFTGSSSGLVGYFTIDLPFETWFQVAGGLLVLVGLGAALLARSDAGTLLVAIRDNEPRCAFLGLDAARAKTWLLVGCAGVAGLAGFVYANAQAVVAPELAGFVFGTELLVAVALGGRGTVLGAIIGAVGIEYLSALISGDLPFLWRLIQGLLFVAVIVAAPGGLLGLLAPLLARLPVGRVSAALASRPTVAVPRSDAPALEVQDLRKSFGSLAVLRGIDLVVRPGELVALVGPNGAGKSTLMRCLADGAERDSGEVRLFGTPLGDAGPERAVALGLGRKFQTASVFESLTVAEALRVARMRTEPPSALLPDTAIHLPEAAMAVLRETGLDGIGDRPVRLLSHGQKQGLELAMVLALEPRLVLLDEPTAGLTVEERRAIGARLVALAQSGVAVILVEHDLDFVRAIASRVVVLHQGALLLDGSVAEVVASDLVREVYAGDAHV
jgi:branched-chain amino acid transport system permease protein